MIWRQIEETKRLIAVYRNANEVIVGTQDEVYSRRGLMNRSTVTGPILAARSSVSSNAGPTELGLDQAHDLFNR